MRSPQSLLPALLLLLLAACGQQGGLPYAGIGPAEIAAIPQQYYPPPGPPGDPWGPYIREAAARYTVPEQWVRAVMQQESGGQEQAVSPVGAMGLMQVMPETYEELRERYGLGADPYDPHNNILAGTAYIHEMYLRFGTPGFLAGYNAGPDRVDLYLAGGARLPAETVNYIAAITPNLGDARPPEGPFARYASAGRLGPHHAGISVASLAAGCDLNAAYDPNHPCTSLETAAVTAAPQPPVEAEAAAPRIQLALNEVCDPDLAFDPDRPCRSTSGFAPVAPPRARNTTTASAARSQRVAHHSVAPAGHDWAIQVGAFANPRLARAMAEGARRQAHSHLRAATLTLPPTPYKGSVLYRARLAHLSEKEAASACTHLNRRQLPCVVVRPSRS